MQHGTTNVTTQAWRRDVSKYWQSARLQPHCANKLSIICKQQADTRNIHHSNTRQAWLPGKAWLLDVLMYRHHLNLAVSQLYPEDRQHT